jgi:hypothetical protein
MKTHRTTDRRAGLLVAIAVLCLAGCDSGGGNGGGGVGYALGGTVTGLASTLVLGTNRGERLTVRADGRFRFKKTYRAGDMYSVFLASLPPDQACTISYGSGSMPAADVTNVDVRCGHDSGTPVSIGGTIQGLVGEVTLRWLAYADEQTFASNGTFTFDEFSALGNSYEVAVVKQPDTQVCSVRGGFGTVRAPVSDIVVSCVDANARFALRGTVTGLNGTGLRIEAGPGNAVEPAPAATAFVLPVGLANTAPYDVGVAVQPAGQTCIVVGASGRIDAADIEDISVQCIDNDTDPLSGTYAAPGLQPGSYVYVTLFPDGVYLYASIEDNGSCNSYPYNASGNGVEYGVYGYDAAAHTFAILSAVVDTNGLCGVWDDEIGQARYDGTLTVAGSGPSTVLTLTPAGGGAAIDLVPVPSVDGEIVGSWAAPYQKNVAVFLPAGGTWLHYLMTETQTDASRVRTGALAGIEYSCALADALAGGRLQPDFSGNCNAPTPTTPGARDLNERSGLWPLHGPSSFSVTGDTMTLNDVEYRRVRPQ